jgi:hypothetical protein
MHLLTYSEGDKKIPDRSKRGQSDEEELLRVLPPSPVRLELTSQQFAIDARSRQTHTGFHMR